MAVAVVIPKMGMTMEEGTLVEWLVPEGREVQPGEALFHMVTEKLDCDVEAEAPGRLVHAVGPDTTLAPGAVVGWLLEPGEEPPGRDGSPPPAPPRGGRVTASPNARRRAAELGVDLGQVQGTGPGGRITSEDVEAAAAAAPAAPAAPAASATAEAEAVETPAAEARVAASPRAAASPIARKLAARLGVDLDTVTGSGPGGRITRQDVEAAVRSGAGASTAPSPGAEPTPGPARRAAGPQPGPGDSIRLVGMRGTIARRMHESLQTMAQLTLGMDVEADRLVALRDQLREEWAGDDERRAPSYTDFVVKAVAVALRDHPLLNARVTDDAVELLREINVGLAIALDHGLVVPVLRATDELTLAEIALESVRLSTAARDGSLTLDDLEGGTFSVTTLGAYGVDLFTPVVNPPNVAILGVGRLRDDIGWDGDVPRKARRLTLSLTFDHRAVDGAPAAAFLAAVRDLLQRPARLLT